MSNFSGNNVLVMLFSLCLLLLLNIVLGSPPSGIEDYHNLFGLSSREEVVEIAGYGEEKLSTVLITGSLHCELNDHHSHAWPIPGTVYTYPELILYILTNELFLIPYVCVINIYSIYMSQVISILYIDI